MNDYVYLGKIVNTHGIKGELRIRSDFELKGQVFVPGFKIYVGDLKQEEEIVSYRHHKEFDMVVLKGYNNINEVLDMVKSNVYVKRSDLVNKNDYIMDDLIGFKVLSDGKMVGSVIDYVYNKSNTLLVVMGNRKFYVPMEDVYIKKIDTVNKEILGTDIDGLII